MMISKKLRVTTKIGNTFFLLSAYMKYIRERIGFTPKILKFFFA
jgi:hypothetical protein